MGLFISHSRTETEALGETWGGMAQSGWVIGLCGELGAGKTQLAKGLARGLGSPERVQSPTFALVNVYGGGRLPVFHLDLYRLETRAQILSAGLDEYLRPSGVTVIEWAERWFEVVEHPDKPGRWPAPAAWESLKEEAPGLVAGARLRWVVIETLNEAERRIVYEDFGF